MKLPEGWPTEEMIAEVEGLEYDFTPGGSETVTGCVSEEMAREIFEKMYAAAPTPSAQEDELRKSAEDIIFHFDLFCRESACFGSVERIEKLRAALERK